MTRLGVIPSSYMFAMDTSYIPINQNMKQYYLIYDQLTFGDNEVYLKTLDNLINHLEPDAKLLLKQRISDYREMMEKKIAISVLIDEKKSIILKKCLA